MPSVEAPSVWAQFGLAGLVIGTLFMFLMGIIWLWYKERKESRADFRETLEKVAAEHKKANESIASEVKDGNQQLNATLREFNATIAQASSR